MQIVEREFSVDDGTKERANNNRGLYRLTDNFFRFWYAFVFTNISELETIKSIMLCLMRHLLIDGKL